MNPEPNRTPEERQLHRDGILMMLEGASPHRLTITSLHHSLKVGGYLMLLNHILEDLHYLQGKGFVAEAASPVSRGLKLYELTAAGRDHLEEEGLA